MPIAKSQNLNTEGRQAKGLIARAGEEKKSNKKLTPVRFARNCSHASTRPLAGWASAAPPSSTLQRQKSWKGWMDDQQGATQGEQSHRRSATPGRAQRHP